MGISYKVGVFNNRVGTGTQDITNVGFQPKALIIFYNATANETYRDSQYSSFGFSDGTTDCSVGLQYGDNAGTSLTESNIHNDSILDVIDNNGTIYGRATLNAWLSNGFQLNWVVNTLGAGPCYYVAIGGDDITNVKVGTQSIGTTTTGNKAYTGVGFQGDFLLTAGSGFLPGASAYTYNTTTEAHGGIQLGCAKSSTARWAISTVSEDGRAQPDSWNYQRGDKCFVYLGNTTGALLAEADFVSFDTDGFTFNYTTNTTANNQNGPFIYLAIKGGVWDVGYFQSPATNTTVQTNTTAGSGNTLKGIFTADTKSNLITSTTISSSSDLSMGASDGTNDHSMAFSDIDAADPSVVASISSSNYNIWQFTANATATSSALNGRATTTLAQNSFTTTWSDTDGTQRYIPYWALSEGVTSQQYDRPISETSVSISESLARVQVKVKPISETAVTISETLARIQTRKFTLSETAINTSELLTGTSTQQYDRPISEPTINISEQLTRIQSLIKSISDTPAITVSETLAKSLAFTKTINESTINTNDTIVRIPLYLKPISETAITTTDSIARWISVSYTLAEPSISVNDTIQGALFYLRQISESAISVNETLTRILTAIRAISDPSISVSESLIRLQTLIRAISDSPSISVSESLVRIPTYLKPITETAITTNDSIVRILAAVRTIADPSLSISDTIVRIQTILKQISESAISVNDSLQAGLLLTISLIESRVKWYYSLLTRKITV